jgi:hypothetical protein
MPPQKRVASIPTWQWFLLSAALPLVFLASKLNLDLWEDEIYTLTVFAAHGPAKIVTDYSNPNNHVLYSLLLWPFCLAGESTFLFRLPSLACAAGTLWLVFRLAHRFAGLPAALAATATLGLNQLFLVYAIQVRGYGLSMLLAALLANFALANPVARPRLRLAAVALAGAAFLYVMPTNALFFPPLAVVAIVWAAKAGPRVESAPRRTRSKMAVEAVAWISAGLLAAGCYLPIYRQVLEHAPAKGDFSWQAIWFPTAAFFAAAAHDVAWLVPLWVAGVFCWLRRIGRRLSLDDVALPVLSGGVALGAFILTGIMRISPFVRNYMPLVPLLALGAGWSLAELLEAVRRRFLDWLPSAVSGAMGLLIVMAVLVQGVVSYPRRLAAACRGGLPQDGYFNYYAADYRPSDVVVALSDWTRRDESYSIVYAKADHWNLAFYLDRAGVPPQAAPLRPSAPTVVYVVAPQAALWDELAVEADVPADELRAWPIVGEFGYYRVYRGMRNMKGGTSAVPSHRHPCGRWWAGAALVPPYVACPFRSEIRNRQSLSLVFAPQLRQHAVVFERRGVADRGVARRDVAQQPAHDLAAARFGQGVREADVVGLGQRADFLADVFA